MGKRTALYDEHVSLGAKIVEFAGWDMPVEYSGIKQEHLAVRNSAGIFDVSHMGEIFVSGSDSERFLSFVFSNDVVKLTDGRAQYGYLPNTTGGIVDDIIVYRLSNLRYLLVVNASNVAKDFAWLTKNCSGFDVSVVNESMNYSQIALQGPKAGDICAAVMPDVSIPTLPFSIVDVETASFGKLFISSTGYTGSGGFEIYLHNEFAPVLWNELLKCSVADVLPIGLGARDTLRLEKGYSLYGHELTDERSPIESGLGWVTKLEGKAEFISPDITSRCGSRKIVGFVTVDRAIPRDGYEIQLNDQVIGIVTSGGFSPVLEKGIGLAFLEMSLAKPGAELDLMIRGKKKKIKIVKLPIV